MPFVDIYILYKLQGQGEGERNWLDIKLTKVLLNYIISAKD